jgi:hypothetical protein
MFCAALAIFDGPVKRLLWGLSAACCVLPTAGFGALFVHGIGDGLTPSTPGAPADGEYATGYSYDWTVDGDAGDLPPDGHFTMRVHSNLWNNQWLAASSSSPWNQLDPDDGVEPADGIQPTIHFADAIAPGSSFYFAQTFSAQLNEFSTGTRIANDLFKAGMNLHVGLRNLSGNSVLGSVVDNGGSAPVGGPTEFNQIVGLNYGGYSQGYGVGDGTPSDTALSLSGWTTAQANNYEWIKYVDNADPNPALLGTTSDDILLHLVSLKSNKGTVSDLSEIVWFFDVPANNDPIAADDWEDRLGVNVAMADTDPTALDDVVFSWTINAKAQDPKFEPNPDFETPSFPPAPTTTTTGGTTTTTTGGTTTTTTGGTTTTTTGGATTTGGGGGFGPGGIPEPSRVVLLLSAMIAMIWKRKRALA